MDKEKKERLIEALELSKMIEAAVTKAIKDSLTSIGLNDDEAAEDIRHMRCISKRAQRWLNIIEKVIITAIAGGFVTIFFLAMKVFLQK